MSGMRRRRPISRGAATTGLVAAFGFVIACAGIEPPRGTVAQAELAVEAARQATATQHAPLELYQAQEKLEKARAAMEDEENREALRLAEEALIQAQVAEERALGARARQTAQELRTSIESLRAEAERTSRARSQALGAYGSETQEPGATGTTGGTR